MNIQEDFDRNMNSHVWRTKEIHTISGAWVCELCGVGSLQPQAFQFECFPLVEIVR